MGESGNQQQNNRTAVSSGRIGPSANRSTCFCSFFLSAGCPAQTIAITTYQTYKKRRITNKHIIWKCNPYISLPCRQTRHQKSDTTLISSSKLTVKRRRNQRRPSKSAFLRCISPQRIPSIDEELLFATHKTGYYPV